MEQASSWTCDGTDSESLVRLAVASLLLAACNPNGNRSSSSRHHHTREATSDLSSVCDSFARLCCRSDSIVEIVDVQCFHDQIWLKKLHTHSTYPWPIVSGTRASRMELRMCFAFTTYQAQCALAA
eukprot:4634045-Amphidinium_carterae.1